MRNNRKTALIFGVSGQDGSYLAKQLLKKGYKVFGTSRNSSPTSFYNHHALGIGGKLVPLTASLTNYRSVHDAIEYTRPDELYNLAGLTSVGMSFKEPLETIASNTIGTLHILESVRELNYRTRLYFAGSSECFGDTTTPADELTVFHPKSPYAISKSSAYWLVSNYRNVYDMFACTGLLFNHESPLRGREFVISKIVAAAREISSGRLSELTLGDTSVIRDWGWAPEYTEAMWLMLQTPEPDDYVVATGESHPLDYFVEMVFSSVGLDWREHVRYDSSNFRPTDVLESRANPEKAFNILGWQATTRFPELVENLVNGRL